MPRNKRSSVPITVDEFVAALQRSSLPTVIVEGDDDIIVFRQLEQLFADRGLSVMPVGGRDTVLALFDRNVEFGNGPKVVFVADRDTWVNHGVPAEYQSHQLILTDGYSIENDVIRDLHLEGLMTQGERSQYLIELHRFLKWYALALVRRTHGTSPNRLLNDNAYMTQQMLLKQDEEYPNFVYFEVRCDYSKVMRGKSLLALIVRRLSYAGRNPRHNAQALLEMTNIKRGPLLEGLFGRVGQETAS